MIQEQDYNFQYLKKLPVTLPRDGAVNIILEEGVPIFRATTAIDERIEYLLAKQESSNLSATEEEELDQYEQIDDYLSHLNRLVRNIKEANVPSQQHSTQHTESR